MKDSNLNFVYTNNQSRRIAHSWSFGSLENNGKEMKLAMNLVSTQARR